MAIYHMEVHSKEGIVEHYVIPNCESQAAAISRLQQFYVDLGQRVGIWDREVDRLDPRIKYLIFKIDELPGDPVVYISGEYRSQFPL